MVLFVNKYRLINYKIILSDLVSIITSVMDLIMLIVFIFFIYLLATCIINCIKICYSNCLYSDIDTEYDIPLTELDRYTIELLEHQLIEIEKQLLLNEIRNFNKLRLRTHKDIIIVINPDNHITIGESI